MRRRLLISLSVYAILISLVLGQGSSTAAKTAAPADVPRSALTDAFVPDEVLVHFQDGTSASEEVVALAAVGGSVKNVLTGINVKVVQVGSGRVTQTVAALAHSRFVRYVEPNYVVRGGAPTTQNRTAPLGAAPNDPLFGDQWALNNTGQLVNDIPGTPGADIKALSAWTVTTGSSTVIVGDTDTGFDYTHPDLAANVWSNPGGIGGCAAGTHGIDATVSPTTCDPTDSGDHGTHVSGIIGAVGNNGVGVTGISQRVKVMGLKFLDSVNICPPCTVGQVSMAITVIDFAVQAKAAGQNVVALNASWGMNFFSQALFDEITKASNAGILFVASAGNDAVSNDTTLHYPSNYNIPNIIAVAATDQDDHLATFSDWGPTTVHLGAPGDNILSTTPNNTYAYKSGTSMAAPLVTGTAALLKAAPAYAGLTMSQLRSRILTTVDPLASLAGLTTTGGRLNTGRALGALP